MKAIVFDFDGVLLNTYENHYQNLSKKYKNFNREIHKQIFEGNIHKLTEKLELLDNPANTQELNQKYVLSQKLEEEIRNILQELKTKYKLFIISSNREYILKEFFDKENLSSLFDEILGYETNKLKDEKFKIIFDKYNLTKDDLIFVTDTLGDILEAKKLDVKSIAIDFGFHERKRLEKGNPWKIASNFQEVHNIIKEM